MSDTVASTLGRRLLEARQARRLTQRELADLVDMAPEVLGRLERGTAVPRADTLARLATALRTSTDGLLGLTGAQQPPSEPVPDPPELRRLLRRLRGLKPDTLAAIDRALGAVGRDAVAAAKTANATKSRRLPKR